MVVWGVDRWGVRRLLTHVRGLPRDSAYARARSGEHAYWDESTELLATVDDTLERLVYYTLAINGTKTDVPQPYPRPGRTAPEPETVTLAGFNDFLKG